MRTTTKKRPTKTKANGPRVAAHPQTKGTQLVSLSTTSKETILEVLDQAIENSTHGGAIWHKLEYVKHDFIKAAQIPTDTMGRTYVECRDDRATI